MEDERFRITTERLVIRPWRASDRDAFRALATDPRVMRFVAGGRPWSEPRISAFFARQAAHLRQRGFCLGALELAAEGRVIGLSGLQPLGTTPDVEVGWWLAPDCWGRGLATEAGRGAIRHGFDSAGLARLTAIAHPDNRASLAVMERLGLRFERRARGHELGLATPDVEVVLYALPSPRGGGGA